jgi:hypothetical protein
MAKIMQSKEFLKIKWIKLEIKLINVKIFLLITSIIAMEVN